MTSSELSPATNVDPGALTWIKATASHPANCVELAKLPDGDTLMRNSRDRSGPTLRFTPAEIEAFISGAKDGEFDRYGA